MGCSPFWPRLARGLLKSDRRRVAGLTSALHETIDEPYQRKLTVTMTNVATDQQRGRAKVKTVESLTVSLP